MHCIQLVSLSGCLSVPSELVLQERSPQKSFKWGVPVRKVYKVFTFVECVSFVLHISLTNLFIHTRIFRVKSALFLGRISNVVTGFECFGSVNRFSCIDAVLTLKLTSPVCER